MLRAFDIPALEKQHAAPAMAAVIERAKHQPGSGKLLLPYLRQQHHEYRDKSANEVKRKRAFVFAAFLHTGLPEAALPFVLEVLETEQYAYLVAAAAVALRGLPEPRAGLCPYLLKAVGNVRLSDNKVSFYSAGLEISAQQQTTALAEICTTFEWLGSSARQSVADLKRICKDDYISDDLRRQFQKAIDVIENDTRPVDHTCCEFPGIGATNEGFLAKIYRSIANRGQSFATEAVRLEDHNQSKVSYTEYFTGKPAVVVFFYTRCDNPNKCSLTIARLRDLQKELSAAGFGQNVRVAAVSYDSFYDDPFRMKAYCQARGMTLDENNRVFRVEAGMGQMLRYFDLGVNYMGSIVNHHTTELFVLDHHGAIVGRHRQLRWKSKEVIAELGKLVEKQAKRSSKISAFVQPKIRAVFSAVLSFIIVFFPKCPFCLAAYLSVFGITNMHFLRFAIKLLPLFVALLCLNLYALYKGARRRNGLLPFYLSLSGLACMVVFGQILESRLAGYVAIGLMLTGALLNSMPPETFSKLRLGFSAFMQISFRQTNR